MNVDPLLDFGRGIACLRKSMSIREEWRSSDFFGSSAIFRSSLSCGKPVGQHHWQLEWLFPEQRVLEFDLQSTKVCEAKCGENIRGQIEDLVLP